MKPLIELFYLLLSSRTRFTSGWHGDVIGIDRVVYRNTNCTESLRRRNIHLHTFPVFIYLFFNFSSRSCVNFFLIFTFYIYFSVRCSQLDGNGTPTVKTTLHDLYEQQGQSPWYDNLCRPVTDLLPLITSGVRGVTSNPTVISLLQKSLISCLQIEIL